MPSDTVWVWHEPQFKEMTQGPQGLVAQDLLKRGEKLRVLAIRQVGKHTGELARSIKVFLLQTGSGLEVLVGSDHPRALMVHQGTRPHLVKAKFGRMLRFRVGGRIVYAQKVHNRGMRPNKYLTDNLRRVVVD